MTQESDETFGARIESYSTRIHARMLEKGYAPTRLLQAGLLVIAARGIDTRLPNAQELFIELGLDIYDAFKAVGSK